MDEGESERGQGPVWIGDLGVALQGDWGLGPESGVGVWVASCWPTFSPLLCVVCALNDVVSTGLHFCVIKGDIASAIMYLRTQQSHSMCIQRYGSSDL